MQTRPQPTTDEVKALQIYMLENDCLLYKALKALFPKLYDSTYQYNLRKAEAHAKSHGISAIEALRLTSPASFAEYWRIRGGKRHGSSYPTPTPDYRNVAPCNRGHGKVVR